MLNSAELGPLYFTSSIYQMLINPPCTAQGIFHYKMQPVGVCPVTHVVTN